MKTLLTGILAVMVLCGYALAQEGAPPSSGTAQSGQQNPATQPAQSSSAGQPNGTVRIAPGSVIPVQLTRSIDAKKAKAGDEVEAKVTQDLKTGNGDVIVPKDTKILGRVTTAQARSKEQKDSQVGIAFDHAVIKNGTPLAMQMSIQAIIAPAALHPMSSNGATEGSASSPGAAGMPPSPSGGRSPGMGSGTQSSMPGSSTPSNGGPDNAGSGTSPHQPITGNTEGVVGMPDLNLSAAANASDGSVVSSQKVNVKLESGTLMLLRVNQ